MKTAYFEEIRNGKKKSTAYLEHIVKGGESNKYLKYDLMNNFQTVYFELARLELLNRGMENRADSSSLYQTVALPGK